MFRLLDVNNELNKQFGYYLDSCVTEIKYFD